MQLLTSWLRLPRTTSAGCGHSCARRGSDTGLSTSSVRHTAGDTFWTSIPQDSSRGSRLALGRPSFGRWPKHSCLAAPLGGPPHHVLMAEDSLCDLEVTGFDRANRLEYGPSG